MDMNAIVEKYQARVAERENRLREFAAGKLPFLVIQRPNNTKVWNNCSSSELIMKNNLALFEDWVNLDWTDELPYLEPWIGVGVYASAFGCEYLWRENEAPATHYRYLSLSEAEAVAYPDWKKNPIMRMVLDTIDMMNERTGGQLPIALTDTQSPFDTATLIVDSTEFIVGCYEYPETAKRLLGMITDLIVEFSREQLRRIGPGNAAKPGHIMVSAPFFSGISVSDDNLSFCSPDFNAEFSLPYNYRLAEAFGGVYIHSCGVWAHTMAILERAKGVSGIDCASSLDCDPNPNLPAAIRAAMSGKGIPVKIRMGNDVKKALSQLGEIVSPDIQLIIEIGYDPVNAETNYRQVVEKLNESYRI